MSSAANADHPASRSESGGGYVVCPKAAEARLLRRSEDQPRAISSHLFMQQRLPVWGHRSGRPGDGLIRRTRVRALKLRARETLSRAIIVKPSFARLEARDDRMARRRVVFQCVLVW